MRGRNLACNARSYRARIITRPRGYARAEEFRFGLIGASDLNFQRIDLIAFLPTEANLKPLSRNDQILSVAKVTRSMFAPRV